MRTSKKKLKHTPHIVRGQHGKFYATTWGNPYLTAEQRKLHDKAQTFTDRLNRKA